ncbi:hypothetical protein TRICI_000043 [Trichomonascus ciferrii]|uniref:Protein kinase domain-containing protein n=1 Tax=Trichomonascus ciferrii TaxID=44093 RepID=A0A642VEI9_9ASCO|nr:hypothetical protein TRICI_000043 [Trichomonascus ciferrii]
MPVFEPSQPQQQQQQVFDGTGSVTRESVESSRKDAYDVAVKQIVAEEKEQRTRLPRYQGLQEDRFKLQEKIGDGAFSVVYRALDLKTNQQVAVKVIHKQDLSSSQVSTPKQHNIQTPVKGMV